MILFHQNTLQFLKKKEETKPKEDREATKVTILQTATKKTDLETKEKKDHQGIIAKIEEMIEIMTEEMIDKMKEEMIEGNQVMVS